MSLHPSLQTKIVTDGCGGTYRHSLPVPECREFWERTESNIKIEFDRTARDRVLGHIEAQRRTMMTRAAHTRDDAIADYHERRRLYVEHLQSGGVSVEEAEFSHSQDSMMHDYEQKSAVLYDLLLKQIAAAKKDSKDLIASVIASLRKSREKMQESELSAAARWGTPFEPTYGLLVLASQEQMLGYLLAEFDTIPEMNPTQYNLNDLPPCVGLK